MYLGNSPSRPELDAGSILRIAEGPGVEYQVDVVFEKEGNIFRVMHALHERPVLFVYSLKRFLRSTRYIRP